LKPERTQKKEIKKKATVATFFPLFLCETKQNKKDRQVGERYVHNTPHRETQRKPLEQGWKNPPPLPHSIFPPSKPLSISHLTPTPP